MVRPAALAMLLSPSPLFCCPLARRSGVCKHSVDGPGQRQQGLFCRATSIPGVGSAAQLLDRERDGHPLYVVAEHVHTRQAKEDDSLPRGRTHRHGARGEAEAGDLDKQGAAQAVTSASSWGEGRAQQTPA